MLLRTRSPSFACSIFGALSVFFFASSQLPGDIVTVTGTATTSGQSMWSQGSAYTLSRYYDADTGNLGFTTGDLGIGVSCGFFGLCTGYKLYLTAKADLGVDFGFKLNSGSVGASVPVSVNLGTPNAPVQPGTSFDVTAGGFGFGNGSLDTTGSTAQAYADFNYALSGGIYGQHCFFQHHCPSYGSSTDILNTKGSIELLGLNENNDGQLQVLGQTYGFGQEFVIGKGGGLGTATVNFPHGPDTSGGGTTTLTSSGSTELASLDINLTNIATELLGFPSLNGEIPLDHLADFKYNLFTAELDLGLDLTQSFTFDPTASLYLDVQETGQKIPLSQYGTANILFPDGDSELHITPVIDISGTLTNDTGLCVDPSIDLSALGGSLSLLGINLGHIGPLLHYDHSFGCYGGTIYDTTFNLGGFTEIDGQTFIVEAAQQVPEPVTSWIVVAIVLMILPFLKRRQLSGSR